MDVLPPELGLRQLVEERLRIEPGRREVEAVGPGRVELEGIPLPSRRADDDGVPIDLVDGRSIDEIERLVAVRTEQGEHLDGMALRREEGGPDAGREQVPQDVLIEAFEVDLDVVRRAVPAHDRGGRDAGQPDPVELVPLAGARSRELAQDMVRLVDVEIHLAFVVGVGDDGVEDGEPPGLQLRGETRHAFFAQGGIRFDGDDVVTLREIVLDVVALVHAEIVNDRSGHRGALNPGLSVLRRRVYHDRV